MTHDYLSDEIIATVSFDMPPHGDYLFPKKEIFYGEPSKSRDEAVELAYDSALRYLQKAYIVFIDDANLNELTECKRALLRATSWAEAFEAKCVSQKAQLSNMARRIRLLSSQAPLSPPDQQTPLHSTVVSENLHADLAKGSHVETPGNTSSRQEELLSTSAWRSLF